jgi:hypothetical protein
MRTYTDEYFQNQIEQSQIEAAILKAIPVNVYYYNLIIVLAKLIKDFVIDNFKEQVFTTAVRDKKLGEQG